MLKRTIHGVIGLYEVGGTLVELGGDIDSACAVWTEIIHVGSLSMNQAGLSVYKAKRDAFGDDGVEGLEQLDFEVDRNLWRVCQAKNAGPESSVDLEDDGEDSFEWINIAEYRVCKHCQAPRGLTSRDVDGPWD